MSGRDSSRRREAARRAREAKAARDQERAVRDAAIEQALTDYFQATAESQRVREAATAKAEAVLSEAERVAATPWSAACAAVRRLRDLCGSNAAVAELCGCRLEDVRDMLAADREQRQSAPKDESGSHVCG